MCMTLNSSKSGNDRPLLVSRATISDGFWECLKDTYAISLIVTRGDRLSCYFDDGCSQAKT
jgi:hypothetical protein